MPTDPVPAIAFGPFVLDATAARLTRDGRVLELPPRPFSLLAFLAGRAGQLVTKSDLLDAVWGHRHVSESALKGAINTLRAALGDAASAPCWIETVPRRGYRFIGSVGAAVAAEPAAATVAAGPLPTPAWPLLGRDADLQAVQALLDRQRLVTLAGAGGIGKTRLALALASLRQRELRDGAWLVRLDALADSQALVAVVARSLQLSAEAARSAESLAAACSTLSLLLVLDNCEHLLDAVAVLARQLLAQAPGLRVLATSQEPLRIEGEQVYRVGALGWPAADATEQAADYSAVALFVQRVQALDPAFRLARDNRQAVCELCARLDGLPLALELAAARVPLLGVDGVLARLQQRFVLLTQGPRDAAPRQRTLRATLEWSHALLSPAQRAVLRRLAVFGGTFSLAAAQVVAADTELQDWAVVDAVGALLDKSLLVSAGAAPVGPRLRMFDSIRSLASEQLQAAGELQRARSGHARWMLALLTDAARDAHDVPVLDWTARLLPDVDNLRAALGYATQAEPEAALALFVHSALFWQRAGLKHEAARWRDAVRPFVTPATPPALRAGFAQALGVLCVYGMLDSPVDGALAIGEALAWHHQAGDTLNEYFDLYLLAHAALRVDLDADPTSLWQRMKALEGDDWGPLRCRYARAIPAVRLRDSGDTAGYRRFCIAEIALLQRAGDRHGLWTWRYGLALAEHDGGHPERAISLLQTVVQDIRDAGHLRQHTQIVAVLASLLLERGDPQSLPLAREAVALLRVDGVLWSMAGALAFAPLADGRADDAARVFGWADALLERRGEHPGLLFARLRGGCLARLEKALAPARLAVLQREGARLGDEAALGLALGGADPT